MKDKFDIDYDVRVVERNIRDNKIKGKDYQNFLDNLQDLTDEAEPLVIEDEAEQEQGGEQINADNDISDSVDSADVQEQGEE